MKEEQIVTAESISKSMAASKVFSGAISGKKHTLEKIRIIFPKIFIIRASGAFCLKSVVPLS